MECLSLILIALIISYLIGSIPFGFVISKIKGIDIRQHGSGNIGATNVWRTLGPGFGAAVLLLDALKGVIGVTLGRMTGVDGLELVTAMTTLLGHAFPIYLRFRGGKIIATGLGVLLALSPAVALIAVSVFILTVFISRYISLGSVTAAGSVPLSMFLLHNNKQTLLFGLLVCLIAIYKHIPNLKRIIAGTEHKLGHPKGN